MVKGDVKVRDCRQELVLIGRSIDFCRLRIELDACLLNLAEMAAGAGAWQQRQDLSHRNYGEPLLFTASTAIPA